MATIYMSNLSSELTEDEIKELAAAEKMPIVFDEDCPEMTEDMLKQFHKMDRVLALKDNDLIKKSI